MSEGLWDAKELQKLLSLLFISLLGVILRGRFPAKEPAVIQKMLLQVFVPATLFRGLSKEQVEWSHMGYIAGGIGLLLFKIGIAVMISYACFGRTSRGDIAELRRTAIMQTGTIASGQSVLPYLGEFIGQKFVGLGGMVDLPLKLYMMLVMPFILKLLDEKTTTRSNENKRAQCLRAMLQFLKDPVTLALIGGIFIAVVTQGGGLKALGFAGVAINALAEAQTPVLFFLIGLKLQFKSATPILCMVLLCATYGVTLLLLSCLFLAANPTSEMKQLMVFFVQGAPSVFGLGIITTAVDSGVRGLSTDFAFDIVGLTFPLSALLQCSAGLTGEAWTDSLPVIGSTFLVVSILLRIVFSDMFKQPRSVEQLDQVAAMMCDVQLQNSQNASQ